MKNNLDDSVLSFELSQPSPFLNDQTQISQQSPSKLVLPPKPKNLTPSSFPSLVPPKVEEMTKEKFKKLKTEELIESLSSKGIGKLNIETIFKDEGIEGDSLLGLSVSDLKSSGIKTGTAGKIMNVVNELNFN